MLGCVKHSSDLAPIQRSADVGAVTVSESRYTFVMQVWFFVNLFDFQRYLAKYGLSVDFPVLSEQLFRFVPKLAVTTLDLDCMTMSPFEVRSRCNTNY